MHEAIGKCDKKLAITSSDLSRSMEKAGFVDITATEYQLPIGAWPTDENLERAGSLMWRSLFHMDVKGLHSLSNYLLCSVLGWDSFEMDILLAHVRNEWPQDLHTYWPVRVVHGRKPTLDE
ncbi:MAG: hypothetical protein M1816_001181 [Peltula sp. TS41687]|nr:MAG: hypothetical protein M1816_001181 [Peltula sp. TS41687]